MQIQQSYITIRCLLVIATLGVPWGASISGETYCVDANSGDDGQSGVCNGTINEPWQTMGKVNAFNFLPGDTLLFKRGNTWNERLVFYAYGTLGIPYERLTVGAYGNPADPRPIIDVNGTIDSAFFSFRSYLTLKDLHFKNSTNNIVGFAVTGGSQDITLINVRAEIDQPGLGNNGISFSKGGDNILLTNVESINAPNNGIRFGGSLTDHIGNVVVEDSYVSGPGPLAGGNDCFTIHEGPTADDYAGSGFIFRNNLAVNCNEQGFDITSGSDITLIGNVSRNNGAGGITVGHSADNVTITGHESYDEPVKDTAAAIILGSRNITFKNSIVAGNSYHMVRLTNGSTYAGENISITNNTFVWDGRSTLFDVVQAESVTVENNIFITARQDFPACVLRFTDAAYPPDSPGFIFNNNLYYSPSDDVCFSAKDSSGSYPPSYDFDAFRTVFGQESSGLLIDPQIASLDLANLDVHLVSTSPAIDAGNPAYIFDQEPENNGDRINIGRYGNTSEATSGQDSDGDGLTDQNESCYDGDCGDYDPYNPVTNLTGTDLDINMQDTDSDGYRDGTEVSLGSDPLNSNSIPTILPDGDISLDGQLNAADILLATRATLGVATLTAEQIAHGDYRPTPTGDGQITLGDLITVNATVLNSP